MADITLIPSAKVPLIYPDTSTMSTEWYRFFWNIYGFTGTGVVPANKGGTGLNTIGDHQLIIGNANNVFEPASLSSASINISYPAGFINLELGTSTVTPGTYGSASQVGVFTVNQYGVLTAASNTLIGIDASQIISGTLPVVRGGTGQSTYTDGQLLIGNSTGNTLTKATLTAGTGISVTNGAGSITLANTGVLSVSGTAPVVSSGGATPAISMAAANTTTNGYLTSTDWTTFNSKQAALVSGTNLKTVGGVSLLGSGDVGTIGIAYGGTGQTSFTAGYVHYGSFSTSSSLYFNGSYLCVGGTTLFGKINTQGFSSADTAYDFVATRTSSATTIQNGPCYGFSDGTTNNTRAIQNGAGNLQFWKYTGSWAIQMQIISTGGVQHLNTISVGNATPSTSGAGITFPATQSASTDANTLDDYEEGTWTPTQGSGLTVVGTFSSVGTYTKIGRQVTVVGYVTATTSVAVAVNSSICGALPFVASGNAIGSVGGYTSGVSSTCFTSSSSLNAFAAVSATGTILFSVTYFI